LGRELVVTLETKKLLEDVRNICKEFFLSQGYEIMDETSELIVLKGGDFLWTVLGTYRWHKIVKVLSISFKKHGDKLNVKLHYDISRLATVFSPFRSARHEIEALGKRLDAKIIDVKELRGFTR